MKPVANSLRLPSIGEEFKSRSRSIRICRGVVSCPKRNECEESSICTGYKAQLNAGQHYTSAYCIMLNWDWDY